MKLILFLFSINAFSALAPYYHSVKEIEDLINHPELINILGMDKQITSIGKINKIWTIRSGNCSVEVESKIVSSQNPESPKFDFKFGKLICL